MITCADVEKAGAKLISGPSQGTFERVVVDSRKAQPGDLFVALPGEKTDGHAFLEQAVAQGASGLLVSKKPNQNLGEASVYQTEDCLKTLGKLARLYRLRLDPIVIAITGSNGKTTTKDFLGSILKEKTQVLVTQGNYNNELGLPLTLLSLQKEDNMAVVEMGMRGLGQIAQLCSIAQPQIGIITNVGESHLELLGSKENIARAKGELIENLPSHGIAILNGDDPYVASLAKLSPGKTIFFGFSPQHHLWADSIEERSFQLHYGEQRIPVTLPVYGKHNIQNALAAAAAAIALGYGLEDIARGLSKVQLSDLRLALEESSRGWLLLNDTYNASPASTLAALEVLGVLAQEKKRTPVAVLADMLELGAETVELHRQVGAEAAKLPVAKLVTVGELGAEIAKGALAFGLAPEDVVSFPTGKEAQTYLLENLKENEIVLLKGSRAMAMDKIALALRGGEQA